MRKLVRLWVRFSKRPGALQYESFAQGASVPPRFAHPVAARATLRSVRKETHRALDCASQLAESGRRASGREAEPVLRGSCSVPAHCQIGGTLATDETQRLQSIAAPDISLAFVNRRAAARDTGRSVRSGDGSRNLQTSWSVGGRRGGRLELQNAARSSRKQCIGGSLPKFVGSRGAEIGRELVRLDQFRTIRPYNNRF